MKTTTYTYDATGSMVGASITAGGTTTTVAYAYDAAGMRIERTQGGVRAVYLVDGDNPTGYTQVLEEGADANGDHKLDASEVQTAYTLGLSVLAQATATQVLHLLADAHGSTRAVLNVVAASLTPAAELQHYAYSAYGADLGLPGSVLTNVRYAGEMIDPLTGLSYNRARWYGPATGRFTQRDTYGGDQETPATLNKYLYGNGNPIGNLDPNGHESLAELLVVTTSGEGIHTTQNVVKTERAVVQTMKTVVRAIFLASEIEVQKLAYNGALAGGVAPAAFALAYYYYEWRNFEDQVSKTGKSEKVLATQSDKLLGEGPLVRRVVCLPHPRGPVRLRSERVIFLASSAVWTHLALV